MQNAYFLSILLVRASRMFICDMRYLVSLAILYCGYTAAQAQSTKGETRIPKYANEFLKIGVDARAFGMGNAQTAVSNNVTAGYWNPAGLAAASNTTLAPEGSLMHAAYFANIANYNYGGFTVPIDSAGTRRFGMTLIRMGVDNIPNTLQLRQADGSFDFNNVTAFSASDFAAITTYAWRPQNSEHWSFGTNFKVVYRGVGRFANAWGFGLDAGMRYENKGFAFGINATDITTTYTAWTYNTETFYETFIRTGNAIPQNSVELTMPSVRTGLAYDIWMGKHLSLMLAADGIAYFDGKRASSLVKTDKVSVDANFGAELAYKNSAGQKIAFLRGGLNNLQNYDPTSKDFVEALTGQNAAKFEANLRMMPTVGAGFSLKNTQIDYALANIGNLTQNLHSHVISLKFILY